jgi:hypothetical protein
MKISSGTLIAFTLLLFAGCKKHDYCPKPPDTETCDLVQVIETSGFKDNPYTNTRFRKGYDPVTGKANRIVVGLFQLSLIDSISLLLKYSGNDVYFISEANASDTVLTATFNAGRLVKMTEGNAPNERLGTVAFSYGSARLSNIHFEFAGGFDLVPGYDAYGNVTELVDPSDMNGSYYYTYDVSVTATHQFYSDEFLGDAYNSLYLAQFMRWLPDLEPVSKRLTSRIALSDDYDLYSADLTNHVYDADGKLLSYQALDIYTNTWDCND